MSKLKEIILTDEQKQKLEQYAQSAIDIGTAVQNKPITEQEKLKIFDLINDHRKLVNMEKAEQFLWFDSPYAAKKHMRETYNVELTYENACLGQHDISWLQYYWFYREQLGYIQETEEIRYLYELSKLVGWFWVSDNQLPCKNFIVATSRPKEIIWQKKANNERVIHSDSQMAIKFPDGEGVYVLNNMYVDKEHEWIITTPKDKLTLKQILSIKNSELRSQALRKLDMEKCFDDFNEGKKLLDKKNEYHLYELDFITNNRVYLKMTCPSSGKVAIEAVPPDCRTVDSALIWRHTGKVTVNEKYKRPIIET